MSIKAAIQHNQCLFVSFAVCLLFVSGIFSCHLTQPEQEQLIDLTAATATAAATGQPLPWHTIGLIIGTILGGGAIVDNRRKDVVIKQEQKYSNAKTSLLANLVRGNSTNPPQP